ncbi:MAG TPA: paraquat-inducible protein A [Opitutaceae bacterium]|nr:paraquat-inducible protein A [Opitutaceae bacterium]
MPASPVPEHDASGASAPSFVFCRCCGLEHRRTPVARGEKANCVRCGDMLYRGRTRGWERPLAWSLAGLILAVPALALPLATVDQLGASHEGLWLTAIRSLWLGHMPALATGVLAVGMLAPLFSLALLVGLLVPLCRRGALTPRHRVLLRWTHVCLQWSMPEVYLLAVLVAFIKLGSLVNYSVGPGLWCYAGVSFALIQALHTFDFEEAARSIR